MTLANQSWIIKRKKKISRDDKQSPSFIQAPFEV